MNIYLAARYSRYPEMQGYAKELEAKGHTVTSRWIHGNHDYPTEGMEDSARAELRGDWAMEDWRDLMAAETVVSFTEAIQPGGRNRGGRHVEFGIALASGKDCVVIGPRENVFHCLPAVSHYAEWSHFLAELEVSHAALAVMAGAL